MDINNPIECSNDDELRFCMRTCAASPKEWDYFPHVNITYNPDLISSKFIRLLITLEKFQRYSLSHNGEEIIALSGRVYTFKTNGYFAMTIFCRLDQYKNKYVNVEKPAYITVVCAAELSKLIVHYDGEVVLNYNYSVCNRYGTIEELIVKNRGFFTESPECGILRPYYPLRKLELSACDILNPRFEPFIALLPNLESITFGKPPADFDFGSGLTDIDVASQCRDKLWNIYRSGLKVFLQVWSFDVQSREDLLAGHFYQIGDEYLMLRGACGLSSRLLRILRSFLFKYNDPRNQDPLFHIPAPTVTPAEPEILEVPQVRIEDKPTEVKKIPIELQLQFVL